ncbi:MAG TPA: single-stranded DNA-binding protein [Bryobacteraceae bacterium]|nr:single-stranded DNA-binding protein [Bryobacteraceae bacterium]
MAERSVNKAILVGRLGADAETRYTQNGTPVSRVSVAMNRQWKDREDQIHEDTDWIPVVLWRSERLAEFMTKGKQVYVEGRIQTRSFEDNAGVKRYITEVVAQSVILLGGNGHTGESAAPVAPGKQRDSRGQARPSNGPRDPHPEPDLPELADDPDVPF